MNKLTGKEIIETLRKNHDLEDIGEGDWKDDLDLGEIEDVKQVGGEGEGDTYYQVWLFKDHNIYIRIDGFYTSYNGTDWYNEPYEVRPQEKTITVYE